jgi:hypothetical protein
MEGDVRSSGHLNGSVTVRFLFRLHSWSDQLRLSSLEKMCAELDDAQSKARSSWAIPIHSAGQTGGTPPDVDHQHDLVKKNPSFHLTPAGAVYITAGEKSHALPAGQRFVPPTNFPLRRSTSLSTSFKYYYILRL